jgi:hypothetical protein
MNRGKNIDTDIDSLIVEKRVLKQNRFQCGVYFQVLMQFKANRTHSKKAQSHLLNKQEAIDEKLHILHIKLFQKFLQFFCGF